MIPESFHFLRPAWLWALLALAPFGWSWFRRMHAAGPWERVCDPHLLAQLATRPSGRASNAPFGLLAIGWAAACLAMAGPAWERQPQTSFHEPARSVFVLGLGTSMNQRDVRPSRIARARHKLLDALGRSTSGSVALVVYREEAFAVTPLTDDAGVLREAIPQLETGLMPGRAVLPARGIEEARRLLEPVGLRGARIVLVTDGSDDDPSASQAAARAAAKDGATVSVLAVAGDAEPLEALARSGEGAYAALSIDDSDLERVLPGSPAADLTSSASLVQSDVQTNQWKDLGAWLVWIPLLLAPVAFRKGWAGAILAALWLQLSPTPAQAGVLDAFERPDQRGAREFAGGRFAESAQEFENPAWQAAARYRAGDFAGASQVLAAQPDPVSQYNLGNALAKSGQLEAAVVAYDRVVAAAPTDEDARFNRELVKKLLEQQAAQSPKDADRKQSADKSSPTGDPSPGSDAGEAEKAEDAATEAEAGKQADAAKADAEAKAGAVAKAEEAAEADAEADAGDAAEAGARESDATPAGDASDSPADGQGTAKQAAHPVGAREQEQAQEHAQWMARLPDDPGGLLREKIRRDYLRKQAARHGEDGT